MNGFMKKLTDLFKEAGIVKDAAAAEPDDMQVACDKLAAAMAAYGDGAGLAADHPLHALKALHKEMVDKLAAKAATAKAAAEEAAKAAESAEGDDVNKAQIETEVAKALEPLQKRVADAEKRATDAEAIAKSERDAREVETEKATLRKFRHVTVDVEKDAPILAKLRTANKDVYDFTIAKLEASEAVAKKAALLEQDLGSPLGGAGQTAWAEIEAEADKIVAKGAAGITREKAIDQVMKARPELVTRYKAEQAGSPS